jgi:hypothetical protein
VGGCVLLSAFGLRCWLVVAESTSSSSFEQMPLRITHHQQKQTKIKEKAMAPLLFAALSLDKHYHKTTASHQKRSIRLLTNRTLLIHKQPLHDNAASPN